MNTIIRKWGNSPAVRLPKSLMTLANIALEQEVRITAEAGRIVIEPLVSIDYSLSQLVAAISAGNRHGEVDFGAPVGNEAA